MGKSSKMKITTETISPEIAEKWLAKRYGHQRPLTPTWVSELADIISNGDWEINGDAIRFSVEDELIDGQHRLSAIVRSGLSVESVVIRDLPSVAFDSIDQGRKRTPGHLLATLGVVNPNVCAAIARQVVVFERAEDSGTVPNLSLSAQAVKHNYMRMKDEVDRVQPWYGRAARQGLRSPATLAGGYVFLSRLDRELADAMFDAVETGAGLSESSPLLHLRNKMLTATKKQMNEERVCWIISAWSAFVDQRTLRRFTPRTKEGRTGASVFKTPTIAKPKSQS